MSVLVDSAHSLRRILVRGPNPVGDLVMATACLADIRRSFPAAHITLWVRPGRDRLLDGLDVFDEILIDYSHKGRARFLATIRDLRTRRFDAAILLTNSFRTALVTALAGLPRRVGFRKGGQELFLTHVIEPILDDDERVACNRWKPRPMAEIYADLCAAVGVERGDGRPRLAVPSSLEEAVAAKRREFDIADGEKLIGLAPGASFGASKLWPPELFGRLADLLTETRGQRTIIFAGPGEDGIARDLASHMKTTPIDTSHDPLGLDLLKPFVRDLSLLVTMDSGPRHFGAALGVPTLVVMGPTDPMWTHANLEHSEVVRHDVPCGPCHLQVCPLDHRCMTSISPEEVLERIEALERRLVTGP